MKKFTFTLTVALLTLWCVTGCLSNTSSVIKEFDTSGKLVKETTTQESVVKTLIDSTKNKVVWASDQGWAAGIYFVPPASSAENPAGVLKIIAGKNDMTMLTAPVSPIPESAVVNAIGGFSSMIAAGRAGTLSVTSNGVSAVAGDTDSGTAASTVSSGMAGTETASK